MILSLILFGISSVENPGKKQLLLESGVSFLQDFFMGILGEEGKQYVPYLMSTVIYIGIANIAGVFGFTPPTKDMNVTIALSLMSIILIEYAGFHKRGLKGFLKSFAEPVPIMLPINILEIAIRPTSLCMRLFGNVPGKFRSNEAAGVCFVRPFFPYHSACILISSTDSYRHMYLYS